MFESINAYLICFDQIQWKGNLACYKLRPHISLSLCVIYITEDNTPFSRYHQHYIIIYLPYSQGVQLQYMLTYNQSVTYLL